MGQLTFPRCGLVGLQLVSWSHQRYMRSKSLVKIVRDVEGLIAGGNRTWYVSLTGEWHNHHNSPLTTTPEPGLKDSTTSGPIGRLASDSFGITTPGNICSRLTAKRKCSRDGDLVPYKYGSWRHLPSRFGVAKLNYTTTAMLALDLNHHHRPTHTWMHHAGSRCEKNTHSMKLCLLTACNIYFCLAVLISSGKIYSPENALWANALTTEQPLHLRLHTKTFATAKKVLRKPQ